MLSYRLGSCVLLLLGGACARSSILAPTKDDAMVYSVALDSLAAPRDRFVVQDSTITIRPDAPLLRDVRLGYMGADSAMAAGLREVSRVAHPVPRLRSQRRVAYVSRAELGSSGWSAVAARHPGASGYFRVSGIGYSRDRRHAIVYVEHPCGFNCYSSWLVTVRAGLGGWRVEAVRLQVVV
jgi:hypothetical protein